MDNLNSMSERICVVTGASSGIGKATALELARRGATVILICRNRQKGDDVAREIRAQVGRHATDLMIADLSVQQQVRAVAAEFNSKYEKLHVLVNNAGATFPKRRESSDGIEMTLAVNHLAPFLLTNLLLDKLKATGGSRIVNVNSDAHEKGKIDFNDMQMRRRYPHGVGMHAYANAKLANLLTVYELARRLRDSHVTVNALHPGYVATNIVTLDDATGPVRLLKPFWGIAMQFILTPEKGATTSVYLACSPEVARLSARYFEKCVAVPSSPASRDRDMQRRMWQLSEQLTNG
ncbi:MAG TPA: SDR family oxidoreductase [Alphaproteobacteria bacterium]|nr:SDR family oxidoreductase [Alphaproteobacteria bacterium]